MTTALPFNPEAESALLSRLLIEPGLLPALAGNLHPEDFYDSDARAAYQAMQSLSNQRKPIDIVALRHEAGRELSIDLFDITVGHTAPVDTYAEIVTRDSWRRRFITRLGSLGRSALTENDPLVLITALQEATTELGEGVGPSDILGRLILGEHQGTPPDPLEGVLSPHGTTVLYGDGGDGKGWVAAKLIAQLMDQGRKVAIIDFEMQPQEWAYRLSKFGVSIDEVLYFSPPMTFDRWATEQSARMLQAEGVEFLVVDSAMYASNVEDPYSPNGALAYGRARRKLNNLPALLLAHTTGGADKVFGSVYWKNESRIVWRLNKDSLSRHRYMVCRKANGYSWLEGQRYDIEFNEGNGILELHEHGKSWSPTVKATDDY